MYIIGEVLKEFVTILVAGIKDLASGIAGGVVDMAKALFLDSTGSGGALKLSVFGGIIAIFAGIALAIGITTKVYMWVTSLGK